MELSSSQRRYLRRLTHDINPVVRVGEKGLNDNVMVEIGQALDHHELIKIKLKADRETRKVLAQAIKDQFKAIEVHSIGQVSCFYRPNPEKQVIQLP